MKTKYELRNDGGTPQLNEEEKKALMDEFIEKAKTDLAAEAKGDIEKIQKLIEDEREAHKLELKGRITEADFKAYQDKSHEEEKKFQDRIDEIETKMQRLPLETPGAGGEEEPAAEVKAFEKWLRGGDRALQPEEFKLLQISDMQTGGYLAVDEYINEIIKTITEFSPMRQLARIRPTSNQATKIPKKTGASSAYWLIEAEEFAESTDLAYGLETVTPQSMGALVKATRENLEDSAFNLQSEITEDMGEQFAVLEGTGFISGDGVGKPEGILTNPTLVAAAITSTTDNVIAADDVLKLIYGLKEAYAKNGRFLMKRSTTLAIRLLKEATTNAYMWQGGLAAGEPATLGGYPISECVDMPAIADGALAMAFGDFKRGYTIVDRKQIEIQRLVEKYAEFNQIGFKGWKRVDGQVTNAEAIQLLKIQ